MRGRAIVCLALLIFLHAVWLACSPDQPVLPDREKSAPIDDQSGPEDFEWGIGPIEGITTAWHSAPDAITVPVGTTLRFSCRVSSTTPVQWTNAIAERRSAPIATALCRMDTEGLITVQVGVGADRGFDGAITRKGVETGVRARHKCVVNVVRATPADIRVREVTLSYQPLAVREGASNFETMGAFLRGSDEFQTISAVKRIGPQHYLTATKRLLGINAEVDDNRFASIIEVRVPGQRAQLGTNVTLVLDRPGTHSVSVGPPASAKQIVVDTYSVSIVSHTSFKDHVPLDTPVTFTAITDPPGHESEITWLSSTKYGTATPTLGQGSRFTVKFSDVWGENEYSPDEPFQWVGVRADNARFDQDQKPSLGDDLPRLRDDLGQLTDELGKHSCCFSDSAGQATMAEATNGMAKCHAFVEEAIAAYEGLSKFQKKAVNILYADIATDLRDNMAALEGATTNLAAIPGCGDPATALASMSAAAPASALIDLLCTISLILIILGTVIFILGMIFIAFPALEDKAFYMLTSSGIMIFTGVMIKAFINGFTQQSCPP